MGRLALWGDSALLVVMGTSCSIREAVDVLLSNCAAFGARCA